MKAWLRRALAEDTERSVDRILAAAFFRPRPLQAGATARVVHVLPRTEHAAPHSMTFPRQRAVDET